MKRDEKVTSTKIRAIGNVGKWLAIFILTIGSLFLLAHFALRYGVQIENLSDNIRQHWLFWLCVRLGIYVVIGVFLYRLHQQATEQTRSPYKKLARAVIVCVIAVELINLVQ